MRVTLGIEPSPVGLRRAKDLYRLWLFVKRERENEGQSLSSRLRNPRARARPNSRVGARLSQQKADALLRADGRGDGQPRCAKSVAAPAARVD